MSDPLPPLGLDVAKVSFQAHLRWDGKSASHGFANSAGGFEQLEDWTTSLGVQQFHACLEATGTYSDALADYLCSHGHQISLVNAARVVAFRKSEGIRSKTDQQDAKVLALFCEQKRPALWRPAPAELQELTCLVRRRLEVQAMKQQEVNRLENSRWDEQTRQEIQAHIASLQTQLSTLTKRITRHLAAHASLQQASGLLVSLPGIAQLSAAHVLAEGIWPTNFQSAAQVVGYSGLAVKQERSGTSVHGQERIDRTGNAQLRKALYMPALVAMRIDADFARWVAGMRAAGKPNKVIIVAVMRKLLHLIYGVLKSQQPYDPRKAFPSHYQEEVPLAA